MRKISRRDLLKGAGGLAVGAALTTASVWSLPTTGRA